MKHWKVETVDFEASGHFGLLPLGITRFVIKESYYSMNDPATWKSTLNIRGFIWISIWWLLYDVSPQPYSGFWNKQKDEQGSGVKGIEPAKGGPRVEQLCRPPKLKKNEARMAVGTLLGVAMGGHRKRARGQVYTSASPTHPMAMGGDRQNHLPNHPQWLKNYPILTPQTHSTTYHHYRSVPTPAAPAPPRHSNAASVSSTATERSPV